MPFLLYSKIINCNCIEGDSLQFNLNLTKLWFSREPLATVYSPTSQGKNAWERVSSNFSLQQSPEIVFIYQKGKRTDFRRLERLVCGFQFCLKQLLLSHKHWPLETGTIGFSSRHGAWGWLSTQYWPTTPRGERTNMYLLSVCRRPQPFWQRVH